jgi:hypothetical protein
MATQNHAQVLSIIDDSGLLAIIDAARYAPFVAEDWTYEQILGHFADAMVARTILVWECGDGGDEYRIAVRSGFTTERGFRAIVGSIEASTEMLHLASYTALTMAAQFNDERLPSKHEAHLSFRVSPGSVRLRIVQMFDPLALADLDADHPHFVIEVEPGTAQTWPGVAWETASQF